MDSFIQLLIGDCEAMDGQYITTENIELFKRIEIKKAAVNAAL